MMKNICIFEDDNSRNLHPLSYVRPVFDLRTGILSLKEKIEKNFSDSKIILKVHDYLIDSVKENNPDCLVNELEGSTEIIFINGRVLFDENFKKQIGRLNVNEALIVNDTVVCVNCNSSAALQLLSQDTIGISAVSDYSLKEIDVSVINYPWDLVNSNSKEIVNDFELLVDKSKSNINNELSQNVILLNEDNIFIGENTIIKPGVVIDASEGPVYIGNNVKILPNTVIEGPCCIGDNSQIKIGAKIYEGTSIGEWCKVGGEVEESIIHSYSNKQHDGFLGHSYISSWCNLGADTNTSDLKNNYGNVKAIINDEEVNTGSLFVGLIMGDHSKSAINTQFNTGTVVGVSSNIFASNFPPRYIPSFSWVDDNKTTTYDLEKSKEVADRVMKRRKKEFSKIDNDLFDYNFKLTASERISRNMPG